MAETPKRSHRRKSSPRSASQRKKAPRRREQPLGVGVGDPFAVKRLKAPRQLFRARPQRGLVEIGWSTFGDMVRDLATCIARRYRPEVVLGIAKGGVFVGSAVASALSAEFHPVRVEKRSRDRAGVSAAARFPSLKGKRVLLVDDVTKTGGTLNKARALARKAKAAEIQAAVLVVRPGGARPEWYAIETDALVVFGWDYQLPQIGAAPGSGSGALEI